MHIKKINIKNFRQLKDVEFNFDESLNLVAGSNNSGKTTLLELFNVIFNNGTFRVDDFNNKIRAQMESNFNKYKNKDEVIENFSSTMNSNKIDVEITIEYKVEDNISLIGEYFNELNADRKLIYLKVECFVDIREIDQFEKLTQLPIITKCFYTDHNFEISEEIALKHFKEKFNYKVINAKRDVNDTTSDTRNLLSKNLHNIVKDNDNWKKIITKIKNDIEKVEEEESSIGLESVFDELKKTILSTLIEDYRTTNGGNVNDLKTNLELNSEEILKMLSNSVLLKYDFHGVMLNEGSQGLGYSNLLYILMEIYKYDKDYDHKKINILFIEEPESHMHPAMERRLIKYLKNEKNSKQLIVTSHSKEMVEFVNLESIKVLRSENNETIVYDLNKYCANNRKENKFIKKFVRVISDIFYADKIIMFEGDGERLYLDHIINTNNLYNNLKEKYVAYIQVGGRHAVNYESLLKFLNIKTVIFSDIDYGNKNQLKQLNNINSQCSSNPIVKKMITDDVKEVSRRVINDNYGDNENIVLFTQTEKDGFARSFEDALLFKMYSGKLQIDTVLTTIPNKNWKCFNKSDNVFNIANKRSGTTHLLDRSMSLNTSKTEFIYDYIENDKTEIPDYIERGLAWLMKE